jgi:hypothetical protein
MRIAKLIAGVALAGWISVILSASHLEARASCSFMPPDSMPPLFTEAWVRWTVVHADAVARVRVIGPASSVSDTSKVKPKWHEQIAVQVLDVVSGSAIPSTLFLHGTLHDFDVFPQDSIPYLRAGSSPSCYRAKFQRGGDHLLLLWRLPDSTWTAQGMPYAPSMIQVRGAQDPWIAWVRAARERQYGGPVPNRRCSRRWSYGMRRGTRFARVHGAILLDPPQLNAIR